MRKPTLRTKKVTQIDDEATGKECREWREFKQVSQSAVGLCYGCSQGFIGFLEAGKRHWNDETLEKYIKAVEAAAVV